MAPFTRLLTGNAAAAERLSRFGALSERVEITGFLREGPPARKGDAPQGDAAEDLWRRYYASIFNPSRLMTGAMLREMPKKYWKNMPETRLITGMIAGARSRELEMIERSKPKA